MRESLSDHMKVLSCRCTSEYQDKRFGKQRRIHNRTNKDPKGWRCTVCGEKRVV